MTNPTPQQPAPYGSQPYGQYPTQGGQPPAQQAYGQPQQGYSPYGAQPTYSQQPVGYPQQPVGYPQQPQAWPSELPSTLPRLGRSPVLGIVALAVVVVAMIACSAMAYELGRAIVPLMQSGQLDASNQAAWANDLAAKYPWAALFTPLSTAGFVGFVLGIVATATKRGRGYGIVAIILGVLAPFVMVIAMVVPMMAAR